MRFPLLAVISGMALEALRRLPPKPMNIGFVIRALIAFTLLLITVDYVQVTTSSSLFPYFSGEDNYQERYLERTLGWHYEAMRQVNDCLKLRTSGCYGNRAICTVTQKSTVALTH